MGDQVSNSSTTAAGTELAAVSSTRELAEHHRELIEASAVSPEVAAERGYWTATRKSELQVLGFSPAQRNVPALVVPIRNAAGEVVNYQTRPDTPRIGDRGKPLKYESPAGIPPTLDVPLRCREGLRSIHAPLWVTEGARKADAAATAGLCCVSLPGVWSWVRRLNGDARQVLPDLQRVRLDERKVVVAFDSDAMVKRQVHAALEGLGNYLASQGALVHFAYLPDLEDGAKCGLDDFLAANNVADLWQHVADELRALPEPRDKRRPAQPTGRLLTYVDNLLSRFVHFPNGGEHARLALALFVFHTHAVDAATVTPYIYVRSPQKRSGKTRLLEVLELACRAPIRAASITEAALFQAIEAYSPSLLIDEVDAIFASRSERSESIRGVLNAGNRRGSYVIRGTQDGIPARSDTFCPKVLAGIDTGKLPDTVKDRAVVVDLERKKRSEPVARLRVADMGDEPAELRERLGDWAADNHEALAAYRCEPIPEISDRLEEGWEPLLAIASLAGEDVLTAARTAAVELAGTDDAGEDHGQVLLVALHGIFGDEDAVLTAEICGTLNANDELPFGSYRKDEGINGRRLASLLRPHGIRPKNVRVGGDQGKGYHREQFAEAWDRYTPSLDVADESMREAGPTGEASQASQRPTEAANRNGRPQMAGTESGRNEISNPSEPSREPAGTLGTQGEIASVPIPSHPQTASTSGNGRVGDGGTDGTDELLTDPRAHPDDERRGLSPYDPEVA